MEIDVLACIKSRLVVEDALVALQFELVTLPVGILEDLEKHATNMDNMLTWACQFEVESVAIHLFGAEATLKLQ